MATAITPEKLIGAGYLFFLENDKDPMAVLGPHISKTFTPRSSVGEVFELDLECVTRADSYVGIEAPTERLDVWKQSLRNMVSVCLANFVPPGEEIDWKKQIDFLDSCQAVLEDADFEVLGSAVVAIGNSQAGAESFDTYNAACGTFDHVTSKLRANVIHQLLGDLNRQFFFIEQEVPEDFTRFLTEKLPTIAWAIQRLTREMAFFQDRLKTLLSEKQNIDKELSDIFHQKLGAVETGRSAKVLEEQISRLSNMYSMMATDLHLVSDAAGMFDSDLAFLEGRATEFGADDAEAFPRHRLRVFHDYLKELKKREADFRLSLDNTKAAIDIAQTHAEILRGTQGLAIQEQTRELLNQNVVLQDERASLQAAASVVELVVVFYYTLVSWKTVAVHDTVEALPSGVKFGVVALFSASVVALTHYIGASLHKKKIKWIPVSISAVLVLGSLAAMALFPSAAAH